MGSLPVRGPAVRELGSPLPPDGMPLLRELALVGGDQLFGGAAGRLAPDEGEAVVVLERVALGVAGGQ
jgi:hypothetical protein